MYQAYNNKLFIINRCQTMPHRSPSRDQAGGEAATWGMFFSWLSFEGLGSEMAPGHLYSHSVGKSYSQAQNHCVSKSFSPMETEKRRERIFA